MKKERLVYIDFMKGVCILLIVAFHIDNDIFSHRINMMLQSFRVPLYYFLSGLFFKEYGGFLDFGRRKVNNIIVPYVFFMLLTFVVQCVMWYSGQHWMGEWEWASVLDTFCNRYYHYNTPLWFLISLFEVNMLYLILLKICPKRLGRYALIMLLAFVAWYFRKFPIFKNPAFIDTALMAMPYFVLGWEVKAAGLLPKMNWDKWGLLVIIPVLVFLYYMSDDFNLLVQREPYFFKMYYVPFVAVLSMFWFSKNMPKIPIVTFVGRYSLIVLGTHMMLIRVMGHFMELIMQGKCSDAIQNWSVYACVIIAEICLIPIMVKTFPKFTAQKELIKARGNQ